MKNLCLIEIEMLLQENRRSLTDFKFMPWPNAADMPTFTNKLIVDELNYNKDELEPSYMRHYISCFILAVAQCNTNMVSFS